MAAPGTTITTRDSTPPRTAPTDTGVSFVTGFAERCPAQPVLVTSMERYKALLGARVSYSLLYDALETYFEEGGERAYVSVETGPAAAAATANLYDASGSLTADASLVATAKEKGDYGNKLNVEIVASGGTFVVIFSHDTDGELERSGSLADRAAAVTWAQASRYISLALGASAENPRTQGPTSLAGGSDDHGSATTADQKTALDRFTKDLGPGQVWSPGRTTTAAHTNLLDHASKFNRVALLDSADTTTKSTLTSEAATLRALSTNRYGGLLAPWVVVPGLVSGTTRDVPPSALVAGLIARSDGVGSPDDAAAGDNGQADFALDVKASFPVDQDRDDLNKAGVNLIRVLYGVVTNYGFRTLVDPDVSPHLRELSAQRLAMAVAARAQVVADHFDFEKLDGRGHTIARFGGELAGVCLPFFNDGSLYGETPDEAFDVNVGSDVNTEATIAAGELHGVISLKISPFAERVEVAIARHGLTENLT